MKTVFLLLATLGLLSAGIEEGKSAYQALCKECHGDGKVGCYLRTQSGWGDEFAINAKLLMNEHQKEPKAQAVLSSERFSYAKQNLYEFLKEYASDSGNVAGCGNSCE